MHEKIHIPVTDEAQKAEIIPVNNNELFTKLSQDATAKAIDLTIEAHIRDQHAADAIVFKRIADSTMPAKPANT